MRMNNYRTDVMLVFKNRYIDNLSSQRDRKIYLPQVITLIIHVYIRGSKLYMCIANQDVSLISLCLPVCCCQGDNWW